MLYRIRFGYRGIDPQSDWLATPAQVVANCRTIAGNTRRAYAAQGIDALVTVEPSDKRAYHAMVCVYTTQPLAADQRYATEIRA